MDRALDFQVGLCSECLLRYSPQYKILLQMQKPPIIILVMLFIRSSINHLWLGLFKSTFINPQFLNISLSIYLIFVLEPVNTFQIIYFYKYISYR